MSLESLSLEDSIELVKKLLENRGIQVSEDLAYLIAQYSSGVPTYIRTLTDLIASEQTVEEFEETFFKHLSDGILNDYFSTLFEKFSTSEQEVLLLISRGLKRYSEISSKAINAPRALESLNLKGVIYKKKVGKKEVYYGIKDRLFAAWLAQNEFPRISKLSKEKLKIFYLGFEALVREIFSTLKRETTIKDALGREIKIHPTKKVFRYEGSLGEIDLIAVSKNITYVAEISTSKEFPKRKIDQLIKNIAIAEKIGYKNIVGLAITLKKFSKQTINTVKKLGKKPLIYLLNLKALKKLAKNSEFKI